MGGVDRAPARRDTLNLRWRAEDRSLIDRAARARGVTRTEFVLGASRDRAMEVLSDQVYIELEQDAFDAFADQLAAPAQARPALAKTLRATPPWSDQ
jgi:uncharacterized protein (DUF1778 family)